MLALLSLLAPMTIVGVLNESGASLLPVATGAAIGTALNRP